MMEGQKNDRTPSRFPLCVTPTAQEPRFCCGCAHNAGAGYRCEYGDFQRGECRLAAAVGLQGSQSAGASLARSTAKEFSWHDQVRRLRRELCGLGETETDHRPHGHYELSRLRPDWWG